MRRPMWVPLARLFWVPGMGVSGAVLALSKGWGLVDVDTS